LNLKIGHHSWSGKTELIRQECHGPKAEEKEWEKHMSLDLSKIKSTVP